MRTMLQALAQHWWLLLLRGLVAVLFGVLAFFWPGITLVSLVLVYGAYAIADGVLSLIAAFRGNHELSRTWLVVTGIAGVAAGLAAFVWPGLTGLILLYFIAGWAVITGVMQVVAAFRVRKEIEGEWLLIAGGVLVVLFGLLLFARPGTGALALAKTIGVFAILYGALLIGFSMRLRRLAVAPRV